MMDSYSKFIASSRYARWLPELGRREAWPETVDRYCAFMLKQVEENTSISREHLQELKELMG